MSETGCERAREAIPDFVAGRLPAEVRAAIEVHLGTCAECREEAELVALLTASRPAVPPGLARRIEAAVRVVPSGAVRRPWWGLAAAAVAALALGIGVASATTGRRRTFPPMWPIPRPRACGSATTVSSRARRHSTRCRRCACPAAGRDRLGRSGMRRLWRSSGAWSSSSPWLARRALPCPPSADRRGAWDSRTARSSNGGCASASGRWSRQRLGLDDEQAQRLNETVMSFQQDRMSLWREEQAVRKRVEASSSRAGTTRLRLETSSSACRSYACRRRGSGRPNRTSSSRC